ncbi:MAG: anthranilate synthase component I family protein [Helicobacteraceae bacterium]|nr:anthranilate synthase component I family protein [Helicobacteraceae bacterium]
MVVFRRALYDTLTPIALYDKLARFFAGKRVLLFESGLNDEEGNFSVVAVGARERVWRENGKTLYFANGAVSEVEDNPLAFLKKRFASIDKQAYKTAQQELGVGFADGFLGFIGYDAVRFFEPSLRKVMDDLTAVTDAPEFDLARPEYLFIYAHKNRQLIAISSLQDGDEALQEALKVAKAPMDPLPLIRAEKLGEGSFDFSKEEFMRKVELVKEEIRSGEIFQMLLADRFIQPARIDPFSFYRVLRSKNPSPYQFLLPYEKFAIVGSSPEMMARLNGEEILLRPIAGTRRRGATIAQDIAMQNELLSDEKERAEHIMLVDLGRNDAGRVAKAGSVRVSNLMHIERFSHVMHIVSDITAQIEEGRDMFDLFMSAFSAGTMTGAPKIRAMELIAKYEGSKRGFYSGAIALFGFSGDMQSAITIRSAQIEADRAIFHAGGGIVADSKPELEWLEVQNKMAALRVSFDELLSV